METFNKWLLGDRLAPLSDEEERRMLALRTAALLLAVGGGVSLAIIPITRASHIHGFHPLGIAIPAMLAVALVPVALTTGQRFSWTALTGFMVLATALITVGVYSAGGQLPFGATLYLWVAIFGFLFLPRRHAGALVAVVGAEFAGVLAAHRGYAAPVTQWLFLMTTAVVTAVVVDRLVRRAQTLASAEREARQQLEAARADLADWNHTLEQRVLEQLDQLEGLGQLRRFLSPQVADAVIKSVSAGNESVLEPHRRQVSVFFCDLRGFTRFAASADPEEVMRVLEEYYCALGGLVNRFQATVGSFAGDGMMAYFNDPVPHPDPALAAVEMAVTSRALVSSLAGSWRSQGYDLGYGVGLALGYATLGTIGFEGRRDYSPVGTVVNLASRLCDEAAPDEILVDSRCHTAVAHAVDAELRGELLLKGFAEPVKAWAVLRVKPGFETTESTSGWSQL